MRQVSKHISAFFIKCSVLLCMCLLLGCHKRWPWPLEDETYRLPRRVAATSDVVAVRMMRNFNRGSAIKVVTIGSDYLIAIPTRALFPEQSPQLAWGGYAVLNPVARFMKEFRKVAVHVTSYTSCYVSSKREHALALARARAVGAYLWSQGIDSRFIFTQGAGSDKPITNLAPGNDSSPSSRIEITFRNAIV